MDKKDILENLVILCSNQNFVDLDDVAVRMGLKVVEKEGMKNPCITKKINDFSVEIFINKNDPIKRKRFSLAHSIAHCVLHDEYLDMGIYDDQFYRYLSANEERKANQLAFEIIMPTEIISRIMNQGTTDLNELANILNVPVNLLAWKMEIPYNKNWSI